MPLSKLLHYENKFVFMLLKLSTFCLLFHLFPVSFIFIEIISWQLYSLGGKFSLTKYQTSLCNSNTGSADMYEMVICSDYLEPYSVGKLASV